MNAGRRGPGGRAPAGADRAAAEGAAPDPAGADQAAAGQAGNRAGDRPADRPSWDEYFLEIARTVASRSTCLRRRVGAVLVRDKRILATGYNGAPSGLPHCAEVGCLRERLGIAAGERHEMCRGSHAEQNVLVQAARYGIAVEGATLYCTNEPCSICTKLLINAGIKEIVYENPYPDELARELRAQASLVVRVASRRPRPGERNH